MPPTPPPSSPGHGPGTNAALSRAAPRTAEVSHSRHASHASLDSTRSTQSRRDYMNSLVPPSKEEFARISDLQVRREAERKRRSREIGRRSLDAARKPRSPDPEDDAAAAPRGSSGPPGAAISSRLSRVVAASAPEDSRRSKAATLIQRTYRGYRARREMRGLGIDASTRWVHALREARFRMLTDPRPRCELSGDDVESRSPHDLPEQPDALAASSRSSTARYKWKKVATIARRAGGDADDPDDSSSSSFSSSSSGSDKRSAPERKKAARRREEAKAQRQKDAKMMGLQYFLEMIDVKHRYGSNLRVYHGEWKKADTNENFFYWLDFGEGRFLDIEACPRERLDREQVRYLSREERQYYLVTVDREGRLCWAKNGARIDTTEMWKDSIHGIVPADDPTPAFQPASGDQTRLLDDTDTTASSSDEDGGEASESELEAARAAKYATPSLDNAKGVKKIHHMSATTILDKLLRKSVRKNTWIFVADPNFRLYVGIKSSGAFQHSSFLQGSRISAAGLIRVHDGRLASLSPLSGHYRPPTSNFRAFVRSLRDEGVDMSHVSISKSYAVLVGLEAYVKTRRKGKELVHRLARRRDKVVAPAEVRRREEDEMDKSQSAARERTVLEEQRTREREETPAGAQLMRKLRIAPQGLGDQKGGDGRSAEGTSTAAEAAESTKVGSVQGQ